MINHILYEVVLTVPSFADTPMIRVHGNTLPGRFIGGCYRHWYMQLEGFRVLASVALKYGFPC